MTTTSEMEMEMVAARLARLEATVARLSTAVDALADDLVARLTAAVEAARPLVVTQRELRAAVEAAMGTSGRKRRRDDRADDDDDVEVQATPPVVEANKATTTLSPEVRDHSVTQMNAAPTPTVMRVTPTPTPTMTQLMDAMMPTPPTLTLSMLDMAMPMPALQANPPPPLHAQQASLPPTFKASLAASVSRPQATEPPRPSISTKTMAKPRVVTPPQSNCTVDPTAGAAPAVSDGRLYLWGNAWHHLPEDFEFPKVSLDEMWRQWCCGVPSQGFRPLRQIQASDIASLNNRKRLSDLKFLMKHVEQQLQERGVWKNTPSEAEASQMLHAVRDTIPFTGATGKNGQKRELDELKWHSVVTLLRSAHKKARKE